MARSLCLILQIVTGTCSAAWCADMVLLTNSDRLTGEIQKLENNRLSLRTEYAGVVNIDWKLVERISTDREFQVEATNQRRFVGMIGEAPSALEILADEQVFSVPVASVVTMEPASPEEEEDGFWRRTQGGVDLGYSLTRGNSELNQSSFGIRLRHRAPAYQVQSNLDSLFSRQSDAPTTSRHSVGTRADVFLGARAFSFALSNFERNDRQLLNLRSTLGGGMGWKIVQTRRTELAALVGSSYIHEDYRRPDGEPERESNGEALFGLSLDRAMVGRITFNSNLSTFRNFIGGGRYRISLDAGMRVPLISRFNWTVRVFERFDSRPPIAVERNDYGVVSNLGVSF